MPRVEGILCAALLLCSSVVANPLGPEPQKVLQPWGDGQAPRKLHGKFLHITDFHPDEFYKVHSSTGKHKACHRGKGPAGAYGAETSDCDSPVALINATFDWIAANLRDELDFIVYTGDGGRHDNDEEIPRSRSQVLGTNQLIADRFSDLLSGSGSRRSGRGLEIPVVPTLGNNDVLPHNILAPGPNRWLQYFSDIWQPFIPEEQMHSFEYGGWFHVEVVPGRLAVFSLNTLYFFDRNAATDNCIAASEPGTKQFEWLRVQLAAMRRRGVKAILIGHVPPARTESKRLWEESCWQKYTLWLQQYRDVVVGAFYGHMNLDHFLFQDTQDVDLAALSGESTSEAARDPMDDELSAQSKADYLQDLREQWSKLPESVAADGQSVDSAGKKKKKKNKDPWIERYQLTMISPSVIPNYYPALRVVEYNISGMEQAMLWADALDLVSPAEGEDEEGQVLLDLRDAPDDEPELQVSDDESEEQGKKKKKKKEKKPKKPKLVVPRPPSKSALPGPAYSPQPLTLTGYTQYFANLTHLNDATAQGGRKPEPRPFAFGVEYSTFDDEIYGLDDLTVKSVADLAYRMGRPLRDELDDQKKGKKGKKKKDKDKKEEEREGREANKTWLHFLRHAFVSTVETEKLKKLDE